MKADPLHKIREYLELGGLFNPELMNHDAVRDLLIEARERILQLEDRNATLHEWMEDAMCGLRVIRAKHDLDYPYLEELEKRYNKLKGRE